MRKMLTSIFVGINPLSILKVRRVLRRCGISATEETIFLHLLAIKNTDERMSDLLEAAEKISNSEPEVDFDRLATTHLLGRIGQVLEGKPLEQVLRQARREEEDELGKRRLSEYNKEKLASVAQWFADSLAGKTDSRNPSLQEAIDKFKLTEIEIRYLNEKMPVFSELQRVRETHFCGIRMPFIVATWLVLTFLGFGIIYSTYFAETGYKEMHGRPDATGILPGLITIAIGQIVLFAALMKRKRARIEP